MAVVLRAGASDHPNLRLSCKRICDIIDSSQFRKERSMKGFAEVQVGLLSPFEQYQQLKKSMGRTLPSRTMISSMITTMSSAIFMNTDYSFETDCFRVYVDGRLLHKLNNEFKLHIRILPLHSPFWSLCDFYNQEVCDLGTTLFTNSGKPKVDSIKGTIDPKFGPFYMLDIQDLMLPYEYRHHASTVGPNLVKSMLWHFILDCPLHPL
jgi:hypothetical protein